ncbi:hypothetical protein DPMN_173965 [Dreissena polymorpha]|uniref:Uncharacterized protein n=1 Tax=Dreissena polymorpha TaxID=45954 RepID=A0A9D4IGM9_DREPO|nr:hypothetical protein DPMN_173965 [Dreissena polymorpha]
MDSRANEESARRCVMRAYGAVSLLQLCLGLLLIISGMLAIKYSQEEFHISRPPYFVGAFLVGVIIICGGICSLYVFMTEAPLLDYYYLDLPSAVKIKRARSPVQFLGGTLEISEMLQVFPTLQEMYWYETQVILACIGAIH